MVICQCSCMRQQLQACSASWHQHIRAIAVESSSETHHWSCIPRIGHPYFQMLGPLSQITFSPLRGLRCCFSDVWLGAYCCSGRGNAPQGAALPCRRHLAGLTIALSTATSVCIGPDYSAPIQPLVGGFVPSVHSLPPPTSRCSQQ